MFDCGARKLRCTSRGLPASDRVVKLRPDVCDFRIARARARNGVAPNSANDSKRGRKRRAVEGGIGVCYSIWFGAWRSLVAHLPWEQGVGRSNRLAPTRASSSGGKSNGLLSRGSGVRIPSGAPGVPRTWIQPSERPGKRCARRASDLDLAKRAARQKIETVVSVAQLAEHRVVAPAVEGSSPFTHPTKSC